MKSALAIGLVIVMISFSLGALGEEGPLTNLDVVKLCSAGLGDDLVVAKIAQSPTVQFDVDTDALVELKEQGVSDPVIQAMLRRSGGPMPMAPAPADSSAPSGPSSGPPSQAMMIGTPAGPMLLPSPGSGGEKIWLSTQDGFVALSGVVGEQSSTFAYVTRFQYLNLPGLRATTRTNDRSLAILVASEPNPTGRFYWASFDPDQDDGVRSVKMGRSGLFKSKIALTPDEDWTIKFRAEEQQPGLWKLTPPSPVEPGEYGILVRSTQEVYDFGID